LAIYSGINDCLLEIGYGDYMLRCGIDMIEHERVVAGIERLGERFLNRFFTAGEREDCEDKPHRLAARLAAKEAVAKALGTGIGDVSWKEIEIRVNNPRKRPVLFLHGAAATLSDEMGIKEWDVSLTHSREYASAMAVAIG
jgi:holo-[acyl-carrier protein] synthase